MLIQSVHDFSHVLDVAGNVRLPKHSLYVRQSATNGRPARFVYVLDMRECLRESFRVHVYIPSTNTQYYYRTFPERDSIGRTFMQYVLREYGDKPYSSIPAPVWPICHKDNIGQPHDRKPQKFDAKRAYVKGTYSTEERSVVDGCVIGTFRHTEESYNRVRLGMEAIQF